MKKIKVLNMVYWLGSGGIERFSVECYRHINKDKIEMDFITKANIEEFYDEDVKLLGAKKISLSSSENTSGISTNLKMLRHALKLFKSGYDVAYFNISSPADALKYPFISRLFGMKNTIVHAHSSSDSKTGLIHILANIAGRKYLRNKKITKLACSSSAARWMFDKTTCDCQEYIEIKNGIDVKEYRFDAETRIEYRRKLGIPADAIVVGQVGRFVELKNQKLTIEVASELKKNGTNTYFIFAGDGKLKSECENLASKLNVQDHILFLGNRKDVPSILKAIDIYVMPSIYEGLPVSGIEAQAAGCKCLFSNAITDEVDVTGNCVFLPLTKNIWVNEIKNYKPGDINYREQAADKVITSGYDINSTAHIIENLLKNKAGGKS